MSRSQTTAAEKAFGTAVGQALAARRRQKDMSGPALARVSDVSIDTIRSIEAGRIASPGLYSVARLSQALEVSLDTLAATGACAIAESSRSGHPERPDLAADMMRQS